jgi:hypothetical protein
MEQISKQILNAEDKNPSAEAQQNDQNDAQTAFGEPLNVSR